MIPFSRLSLLTLVIFLSGLLTSCEFQPHDIPDDNIEKPADEGPPIVLNLNDYHDTIKIGWITDFNYSISGTTNKILAIEISIGGKVIHEYLAGNQQTFSFTFDPVTFPDGDYHLNIAIITTTGSGSIAEKFGVEGYLYELDWPVVIDQEIPRGFYNITFEKVHNPEGLKLSWPEFNHANFVKYVIYRQYSTFQQESVPIAEITDPVWSTFIDYSFWEGQDAIYYVRIITPFGHHDGIFSTYQDVLGGFTANWHNDGTLDVSWNKAQNLEMFGGYYVFNSYGLLPIESYFIGDPEENHVTFRDAGFANGIIIYLAILPKGVDSSECEKLKLSEYTHYTQPDLPLFNTSNMVNNHEFIILSKQNSIYRYFPDEHRIDATLSVSLTRDDLISVSNDGNRFVYFQGSDFYIRRTDDFAAETLFSVPSIPYPGNIDCLSLSDNNRLLVTDGLNHVYLYNTATGQLIRRDSIPFYGWNENTVVISPNGTRMAAATGPEEVTFFSLEPSGWSAVGKEQVWVNHIFYSKDGMFVFLVTYDSLIKRRTSDFELVLQLALPGGYFGSVDLDRDRLLHSVVFGSEYNIVDFNTGQVLKTLNLGVGAYTIFKNHIITSGRQLNLPQF